MGQEKGWVRDDGIRISEVERLCFVSREAFRGVSAEKDYAEVSCEVRGGEWR